MKMTLTHDGKTFQSDLSHPLDISLPLREGDGNPNCYWADPVTFETISSGSFTGSVALGGSVNYQKLTVTPHGNGTHTECIGHITADAYTINQALTRFHFIARVISVSPEIIHGDAVITAQSIRENSLGDATALVIRTLPNLPTKKTQRYSGSNPPYLEESAAVWIVEQGISHLLIDVPSVDREADGGKLLAHKAFWQYPAQPRKDATISELIFVPDAIPDGLYLLNLQITSLEMDASPSKPVLYKLTEVL